MVKSLLHVVKPPLQWQLRHGETFHPLTLSFIMKVADARGRAKKWKLQFLVLFTPCPSVSRAPLPYTTILNKIDGKFRPISSHGEMVRFCLCAASSLILGG